MQFQICLQATDDGRHWCTIDGFLHCQCQLRQDHSVNGVFWPTTSSNSDWGLVRRDTMKTTHEVPLIRHLAVMRKMAQYHSWMSLAGFPYTPHSHAALAGVILDGHSLSTCTTYHIQMDLVFVFLVFVQQIKLAILKLFCMYMSYIIMSYGCLQCYCLQCYDAVGWQKGIRPVKTEW